MEWKYKKIPKVVHFYWDKSPLSFLNLLSVKSFKELNPDWTVKLYEPKFRHNNISWVGYTQKEKYSNINYLQYVYKYCDEIIEVDLEELNFRNDVSEVYKSDFLRWFLLSTEGGLWSDMDVLYIKPMHMLDLVAGVIGSFDFNKQTHISIQRALDDGCEKVLLFGNVSENEYFNTYVKPLLSEKVILVGFIEDKQKMYDMIGRVYLSSLSEVASLVRDECFITNTKFFGNAATEHNGEILTNEEIMKLWVNTLEL